MNWKKFFLDWRKIILTFIITIIIIYFELNCMPRYFVTLTDSSEGPSRKSGWEYRCGFLSKAMDGLTSFYTSYEITLYNPIFWILHLLIFYLLSCFVIWIYDKFRKKKK